ncbi:hypothetical protein HQ865_08450 [Mucilaginibacter mali]|uniref:Uncharacterized protein n=1 Tax=Mucilaginibacter mali TaxID=2740462 RepID=A0A7D4Q8S5_9SPHI|nr:hypothetical protein [Mucilaginibacter mali]QKJ29785.1 hypothetical protein HQ865_08450 [Mucilaginibacter mali]
MANRTYILIVLLALCTIAARAQSISFQQADSTSLVYYNARNWTGLVDYGNKAIAAGVDYPVLRLRMAYANFMGQNYSGALTQYAEVLKDDSHNQMARYYSYLCSRYLGNTNAASYHASFVDTVTMNREQVTQFGLVQAGLESSVKLPQNNLRGTGNYTRAFLSNRLGWKLTLDQSVAYYNQSITALVAIPAAAGAPAIASPNSATFTDTQFEYYGKLGFAVNSNLNVLGAYHYLNTSFGTSSFQNHIGLIGLKYSLPYVTLQADANVATISNNNVQQYNGQLSFYPMGNLNLYTISRVSVQSGDMQQTIFSQTLGFKAAKPFWLEANGTFGTMDNYLDADALYVYNAIDVTKLKAGLTGFFQLGQHAVLYINYAFEQKQDYYLNKNFNQNSITGGFTWKF